MSRVRLAPPPVRVADVLDEALWALTRRIRLDAHRQDGIVEGAVQLRHTEMQEFINWYPVNGPEFLRRRLSEWSGSTVLVVPGQVDADGRTLGFHWWMTGKEWELDSDIKSRDDGVYLVLTALRK